eukprot:6191775-Pleurochrysis_carterae.AAC.1
MNAAHNCQLACNRLPLCSESFGDALENKIHLLHFTCLEYPEDGPRCHILRSFARFDKLETDTTAEADEQDREQHHTTAAAAAAPAVSSLHAKEGRLLHSASRLSRASEKMIL